MVVTIGVGVDDGADDFDGAAEVMYDNIGFDDDDLIEGMDGGWSINDGLDDGSNEDVVDGVVEADLLGDRNGVDLGLDWKITLPMGFQIRMRLMVGRDKMISRLPVENV